MTCTAHGWHVHDDPDDCERPPSGWCVVYRTGGYASFKWHRTLSTTLLGAQNLAESTRLMGYKCHIEKYAHSVRIGLPETWE